MWHWSLQGFHNRCTKECFKRTIGIHHGRFVGYQKLFKTAVFQVAMATVSLAIAALAIAIDAATITPFARYAFRILKQEGDKSMKDSVYSPQFPAPHGSDLSSNESWQNRKKVLRRWKEDVRWVHGHQNNIRDQWKNLYRIQWFIHKKVQRKAKNGTVAHSNWWFYMPRIVSFVLCSNTKRTGW